MLPLSVCESLVKRIAALVSFKDGSKNGKVGDFDGFALILDHVSKALCEARPDHVEELESLSLSGLKAIRGLSHRGSLTESRVANSCGVFDELQVQL